MSWHRPVSGIAPSRHDDDLVVVQHVLKDVHRLGADPSVLDEPAPVSMAHQSHCPLVGRLAKPKLLSSLDAVMEASKLMRRPLMPL